MKDISFKNPIQEIDRYFPGKIVIISAINQSAKINGVFEKDNIIDAIKAIANTQNKTVSFSPGNYFAVIN